MTVYLDGAALKTDFSMKSETLIQAPIPTSNRKCTSSAFLFHQCGFKYEFNGVEESMDYMMLAFGAPKTVHLMMGVESGRLTSTVGQDYIWHRLITMIICLFLSGFAALAGVSAFKQMGREQSVGASAVHQGRTQAYVPNGGVADPTPQGFGQRTGF